MNKLRALDYIPRPTISARTEIQFAEFGVERGGQRRVKDGEGGIKWHFFMRK